MSTSTKILIGNLLISAAFLSSGYVLLKSKYDDSIINMKPLGALSMGAGVYYLGSLIMKLSKN